MKNALWTLALGSLLLLLVGSGAGAEKRPESVAKEQMAFGVEMAQRGLWSEALFRFRQAEGLHGENSGILNNLAVTHEALGNFDQALAYYKKALESDPANRSLKRNYARFVEFYQSFKPPEEEAAGETDPGTESAPPPTTDSESGDEPR